MRIEYGFTDLVLASHAGLSAVAQVLKAARLRAAFGPSLKTIPDADNLTTAAALPVLGERMNHNHPFLPRRPREHGQVRFRLRTAMKTLMYDAAVLTQHACALSLKLGRQTAHSDWVLAVLRASPA